MSQFQLNPQKPGVNLSSNNRIKLDENEKLVERDGGIYLVATIKGANGEIITEKRVDSPRDVDSARKGDTSWYQLILDEEKAHAAAKVKATPKAKS